MPQAKDLPTPTKPWFRFEVWPIATALRPEDPEEGITSDMVIPIYPNTVHPAGRAAIPPEVPFPFPNCYFWVSTSLTVRIRRKAIRYDDSCAPILGIPESLSFGERFKEDYKRKQAVRNAKAGDAVFGGGPSGACAPPSPPMVHDANDQHPPESIDSNLADDDADTLPEGGATHTDTDSVDTLFTPSGRENQPAFIDSVVEILQMDFFGFNPDDTVEFLPLVDLWFEITNHLTADAIPNPMELFKERDTIMQ